MTHMTNYGNDQLALYTISRLVNFVHRWTNLELKYASPIELADIYFNLFPKDKVPVWLVSKRILSVKGVQIRYKVTERARIAAHLFRRL